METRQKVSLVLRKAARNHLGLTEGEYYPADLAYAMADALIRAGWIDPRQHESGESVLEIEVRHKCKLPDMQIGTKTYIYRKFPLFWKKRTAREPIYEMQRAAFTCGACGGKWHWSPSFRSDLAGMWFLDTQGAVEVERSYFSVVDDG